GRSRCGFLAVRGTAPLAAIIPALSSCFPPLRSVPPKYHRTATTTRKPSWANVGPERNASDNVPYRAVKLLHLCAVSREHGRGCSRCDFSGPAVTLKPPIFLRAARAT